MERYTEAIGGAESWRAVESMGLVGTMVMEDSAELALTRILERPGRMRQEVRIGQRSGVIATDGETYWVRAPGRQEARPLPADQIALIARLAEIESPLLGWRAKGHTLELVGRETSNGDALFHLRLERSSGETEHHYLDAESFLPLRVEWEIPGEGEGVAGAVGLGDYRLVDGLMIPHSVTVEGVLAGTSTFRSVELDVDTDETRFTADVQAAPRSESMGDALALVPGAEAPPGWELVLAGGARARIQMPAEVDEGARVSIASARTGVAWHIGLARGSFSIEEGERYRLRFRARADGPRPLSFTVIPAHPPWRNFFYEQVDLTPLWNTIEREFEARFGDQEVRVQFRVGASRWSVDVSEVSVVRLRDGAELIDEPGSGSS